MSQQIDRKQKTYNDSYNGNRCKILLQPQFYSESFYQLNSILILVYYLLDYHRENRKQKKLNMKYKLLILAIQNPTPNAPNLSLLSSKASLWVCQGLRELDISEHALCLPFLYTFPLSSRGHVKYNLILTHFLNCYEHFLLWTIIALRLYMPVPWWPKCC